MRTEALQPLTELDQMYLERLESVKREASENGESERMQAAERAIEEFKKGSEYEVDPLWRDLSKYQLIYEKAKSERSKEVEEAVSEIDSEFAIRFGRLADRMRSDGKTDEAGEVEKIVDQISERAVNRPLSRGDLASMSPPERVFNFSEASYLGVGIGDSQDVFVEQLEAGNAGLKVIYPFGENGRNYVTDENISFRFDGNEVLSQVYVLGEDAKLQDGFKLRESTVSDFERLIGEDADELDPTGDRDKYSVETERFQYDLLTVEEGDGRVFSIMVSPR